MTELRFRQPIFIDDKFRYWHYWGFIDGASIGPDTGTHTIKQAHETSQQFTGLKDKNGKEVWEGDILTFLSTPTHYNLTYEVIFIDGCFRLNGIGSTVGSQSAWRIDKAKIIGNIYENPELVKEKP